MIDFMDSRRAKTEILMFSGGGGTSTSTAQMMPWEKYVPKETYGAYKWMLPKVKSAYDQGLTPREERFYRGQILSDTASKFAGAEKELNEGLTRSGVQGGARAESISDLMRGKAIAGATGLAGLTGKDIEEKRASRDELRKLIGLPSSPVQTGSTTTTSGRGMS